MFRKKRVLFFTISLCCCFIGMGLVLTEVAWQKKKRQKQPAKIEQQRWNQIGPIIPEESLILDETTLNTLDINQMNDISLLRKIIKALLLKQSEQRAEIKMLEERQDAFLNEFENLEKTYQYLLNNWNAKQEQKGGYKKSGQKMHVVSSGETLASIAFRYYRTPSARQKIIEANRELFMGEEQETYPGMLLLIPDD